MTTTALSKDQILEAIGAMSVLDLADLIEAFKTEFTVTLKSGGEKKIQVIKVVRELTSLGLKEAKDLVDNGGNIKEGVTKAEAAEMKKKLEDQGAVVELK